jgi:hypothetical protein
MLDRDGTKKQLTSSGQDSEPVLSPDGRFVVFTRSTAKKKTSEEESYDCRDAPGADQLMRVNADGSGEAMLVRGTQGAKVEQLLCGFWSKQFNSDGQLLYFLTPGWAVSGALHVYDFKAKAQRFVIDANGLHVLSACKGEHKDRVAISRHKYFVFGGSYDWYWLYDPRSKKEIGPLGELEERDLAARAKEWCE